MCKKLSVFCFLLVAVAFCVPASATYPSVATPLKIDIDGASTVTPTPGYLSWLFPRDFSGPQTTTIQNGGTVGSRPILEYTYVQTVGGGGGSRNRSGGIVFVGGTGALGSSAGGFGRNYNQLKIGQLQPSTEYQFMIWSFEQQNVWVYDGNNPMRKFGMWSTVNPNAWLVANGYSGLNGEPNGYGPRGGYPGYPIPPGTTDSNMPAALSALAYQNGGRVYMESPTTPNADWQIGDGDTHYLRFRATSSSTGFITLYGWMDATDWANSMHMPLNGFVIIPEPTTVALLGLGGLALLRRKRA